MNLYKTVMVLGLVWVVAFSVAFTALCKWWLG